MPVLIISKKEGTIIFIKDYHRLNKKLATNPQPLLIIGEKITNFKDLSTMQNWILILDTTR